MNNDLDLLEKHINKKNKSQLVEHNITVVEQLKTSLRDKTYELKEVLQTRHDNLEEAQGRKDIYGKNKLPELGKPIKYTTSKRSYAESPNDNLPRPHSTRTTPTPTEISPNQGLALSSPLTLPTYAQQRAVAIQNIEKQMNEVASLFTRLSNVTAMQGEQIQRIDDNLAEAQLNVDNGYNKLLNVADSVFSNKSLVFKLFLVLIVFILLFVIFLA